MDGVAIDNLVENTMVVAAHKVIVVALRLTPAVVEIHMGIAAYLLLTHTLLMHSETSLPVLFVEH